MMSQEELQNVLYKAFKQNYNFWVTDEYGYFHRNQKAFIAGNKVVILSKSNYNTISSTGFVSKLFKYQTEKILA